MSNASAAIYPVLSYQNAPEAIAWLTKAFGFAKHMAAAGPDDTIAHAELRFGSSMIMLSSARRPDPANPWSRAASGIYVVVDDVDAHYAQAQAAGADIVMPLADTSHGSREYSARDCDGHLWCFGTYRP